LGSALKASLTPNSFCDRRRPQAGTHGDHPFGANLRLTIFALPRSVHALQQTKRPAG
jgi:hypothetical protein